MANSEDTFVRFFAHPIYYIRTFSFSFSVPRRSSDPGSLSRLALFPPPRYGTCLHFYREKSSALSSLVDSHRSTKSSLTRRPNLSRCTNQQHIPSISLFLSKTLASMPMQQVSPLHLEPREDSLKTMLDDRCDENEHHSTYGDNSETIILPTTTKITQEKSGNNPSTFGHVPTPHLHNICM